MHLLLIEQSNFKSDAERCPLWLSAIWRTTLCAAHSLKAALTQQEVLEAVVRGELGAGHGFYVLDVAGQTQSRIR